MHVFDASKSSLHSSLTADFKSSSDFSVLEIYIISDNLFSTVGTYTFSFRAWSQTTYSETESDFEMAWAEHTDTSADDKYTFTLDVGCGESSTTVVGGTTYN